MQTLMDADKRAAYDALMGFTSGAINPFNDRSHAADKVIVCLSQPAFYLLASVLLPMFSLATQHILALAAMLREAPPPLRDLAECVSPFCAGLCERV